MGVNNFFRTAAYYEYHPEKAVFMYDSQLLVARVFARVVPGMLYFVAVVVLFTAPHLLWDLQLRQAGLVFCMSVGLFGVGYLMSRVLGAYRDCLARRVDSFRAMVKARSAEEDNFHPENVDWT